MPAVGASEKGVVVGRLTFTEDGDDIDCRRMGVGGKAIPPNISKVSSSSTLALKCEFLMSFQQFPQMQKSVLLLVATHCFAELTAVAV